MTVFFGPSYIVCYMMDPAVVPLVTSITTIYDSPSIMSTGYRYGVAETSSIFASGTVVATDLFGENDIVQFRLETMIGNYQYQSSIFTFPTGGTVSLYIRYV